MARVFLVNPPTPEPVRSPLLAFGYLAEGLRRAGHEVALLDASAPFAPNSAEQIADRLAEFGADLVGIHIKTLYVRAAYAMVREVRRIMPSVRIVGGGPHATVVPAEPLDHGCDFVLAGEGDDGLAELADALDGKRNFSDVQGLGWRDAFGLVRWSAPRSFIDHLDALPDPLVALDLFDAAWYEPNLPLAYSGLLTSRGCPAACTFCCNNVTGRRFRYRSAHGVGAEVRRLREDHGLHSLAFFDDSFAVGRRRVFELCEALQAAGPVHWSCTAHPSHLDRDVLLAMRSAGCGGLDIGMESADPERLRAIGKGVTVARVLEVLKSAQELGLHVVVNLMFGWPGETARELDRAHAFMDEAAGLGAMFNARGVLVPFPGTEVYERWQAAYGFAGWWLDRPVDYAPFPAHWDAAEVERAYASDAALDANFFCHDELHRQRIAACLQHKARLTYARATACTPLSQGAVPAAGSR
jgi:radical SAM superfamily enzyme YgiQ (UPF0313 family)